jgi:hypothetical protein
MVKEYLGRDWLLIQQLKSFSGADVGMLNVLLSLTPAAIHGTKSCG